VPIINTLLNSFAIVARPFGSIDTISSLKKRAYGCSLQWIFLGIINGAKQQWLTGWYSRPMRACFNKIPLIANRANRAVWGRCLLYWGDLPPGCILLADGALFRGQ
jgi:hypothetical protein